VTNRNKEDKTKYVCVYVWFVRVCVCIYQLIPAIKKKNMLIDDKKDTIS
jgi:surface polysaccharide O-acyltransferase-like enzyme